MKSKNVLRTRVAILIVVMLLGLTILGGAIFALFRNNTENGNTAPSNTIKPATDVTDTYVLQSVTVTLNTSAIDDAGKEFNWIFTSNTPQENGLLYKMVTVTANYIVKSGTDSSESTENRKLEFTGEMTSDGQYYIATTGEHVKFTNNTADNTISAEVKPASGASQTGTSKNYTLSETSRKEIGITATYQKYGSTQIKPSTLLTNSALRNGITVYRLYSDGSSGGQFTGTQANCTLSDATNLFPSKLSSEIIKKEKKYEKAITVTPTATTGLQEYKTQVIITEIEYEAPGTMEVNGDYGSVPARTKELSRSDEYLYVYVSYSGNNSYNAPFSVFPEEWVEKFTYTNEQEGQGDPVPTLSTNVQSIIINVKDKDGGSGFTASGYANIEVTPISIATPHFTEKQNIEEDTVPYDGDPQIPTTGWDWSSEGFDNPQPETKISVKKYTLLGAFIGEASIYEYEYDEDAGAAKDKDENEAAKADVVIEIWVKTVEVEGSAEEDTATTKQIITKKIFHFKEAGLRYEITVNLVDPNEEEDEALGGGDFQWRINRYNGVVIDTEGKNWTFKFTVQVEKGAPDITLANMLSGENNVYGDGQGIRDFNPGKITSARINENEMNVTWKYVVTESGVGSHPNASATDFHYHLLFYKATKGAKAPTFDNTGKVTNDVVLGDPISGDELYKVDGDQIGRPKNAGTYWAVAVTHENIGYESVHSLNAVEFTINARELTTTVNDKEFNRDKKWTLDDLFKQDNTFYYEDKVETVLSIVDSDNKTPVPAGKKFYEAKSYTIYVKLADDETNYTISGNEKVTFTIYTYAKSSFTFTMNGWSYGMQKTQPAITVTIDQSNAYYPSSTFAGGQYTADAYSDFTVRFYKASVYNKEIKGQNVDDEKRNKNTIAGGNATTINTPDFVTDFPASDEEYIVELVAKENTSSAYTGLRAEIVKFDEKGNKFDYVTNKYYAVDYILPIYSQPFKVTKTPIVVPYLDYDSTHWVFSADGEAEKVCTYDDSATDRTFQFTNWALDGKGNTIDVSNIITVTISYDKFASGGKGFSVALDYSKGKFTVVDAGSYTVTISLDGNYSWKTEKAEGDEDDVIEYYPKTVGKEYSFVGYVARKQITTVKGADDGWQAATYDGNPHGETISPWNGNLLYINNISVSSVNGNSPLTDKISFTQDGSATFTAVNAGIYTVDVAIKDDAKPNYVWEYSTAGAGYTLNDEQNRDTKNKELTYTINQAHLKVLWSEDNANFKFDGNNSSTYPRFVFVDYKDDTTAQSQPTARVVITISADNGMLSIPSDAYVIYKDDTFSERGGYQNKGEKVTKVGEYYIAVTKISGDAAPNYTTDPLNKDVGIFFEIYALTLKAPVYVDGNSGTINRVYTGEAFTEADLKGFISNYYEENSNFFYNETDRVEFKLVKNNGEEVEIADVRNVASYTIRIYIKDHNFEWENAPDNGNKKYGYYQFTLIINQKLITISDWKGLTTVYNPDHSLIGKPVPLTDDIHKSDEVKFTLVYKEYKDGAVDFTGDGIAVSKAGKYTVFVKDVLGGAAAGNYKIENGSGVGTSNNSATFIVQKMAIARPVFGSDTTYNNAEIEHKISAADGYAEYYVSGKADVTVKVEGKVPGGASGWVTEDDGTKSSATAGLTIVLSPNQSTFTSDSVVFKYNRAGVYTYTVTLDSDNFYWADEDGKSVADYAEDFNNDFDNEESEAYTLNHIYTIERKTIQAPSTIYESEGKPKDQRIQTWGAVLEFINIKNDLSDGKYKREGLEYTVKYGKVGESGLSDTMLGQEKSSDARGIYFVELTLSAEGGKDPLNYVWVTNPVSDNAARYLDGNVDISYYTEDYVRVRIYYAVTAALIEDLTLTVDGYAFGDNGYIYVGDGLKTTPSASFDLTEGSTLSKTTYGNVTWSDKVQEIYSEATVGWIIFNHYNPAAAENQKVGKAVGEDELSNGLPWFAGTYRLSIRLVFKDGADGKKYEDLTVYSEPFTVAQRSIDDWVTFEKLNVTYNATPQIATVILNSSVIIHKANASGEEDTSNGAINYWSGLKAVFYKEVSGKNVYEFTNADTYKVQVELQNNRDDENNFTKNFVCNLEKDFVINKKTVTVIGNNAADHVFGDEITHNGFSHYGTEPNDNNGFENDGAAECVSVTICGADKQPIGQYADAYGEYYVMVGWDTTKNLTDHINNYTVIFYDNTEGHTATKFNIVPRKINITWNKGSEDHLNSVYSSTPINLYDYIEIELLNTTTDKNIYRDKLAGFDIVNVISLTAKLDNNGSGVDLNQLFAGVGTYYITPAVKDSISKDGVNYSKDNWTITYGNGAEKTDTGYEDEWKDGYWLYEITKAKIEDVSFDHTDNFNYEAKWYSVIDAGSKYAAILNNQAAKWEYAELDNATDSTDGKEWKNMAETDGTIKVKDAGWHYYVVRVSADNHEVCYYPTNIKVYVKPAELTVSFNFTIIYGEDSPESKGLEMGAGALRAGSNGVKAKDNHWDVDGFKGDDEELFYSSKAFFNLEGDDKAIYKIDGFVMGNFKDVVIKDYTITYDEAFKNALTCTNYTFNFVDGKLTVEKVQITVNGNKDLKIVYNASADKIATFLARTDLYSVTYKQYIDSDKPNDYDCYRNHIQVNAYVVNGAFIKDGIPTTAKVGKGYRLEFSIDETISNDLRFYDITISKDTDDSVSLIEIYEADLVLYDGIEGYSGNYTETYHGIMDGDDDLIITIPEDGKVGGQRTADVTKFLNEDYLKGMSDADKAKLEIEFYVFHSWESSWVLGESLLTSGDYLGNIAGFIDVDVYYLVYKITAGDNYNPVYNRVKIEIKQVANSISIFNFANDSVVENKDSNFGFLGDKIAWTYGYRTDDNTGFDSREGHDQYITEPEAEFTRANEHADEAVLKFKLEYTTDGGKSYALVGEGVYPDVSNFFITLFTNKDKFNAGDYRFTISMVIKGSDIAEFKNFTVTPVIYLFRVAKRDLLIKAVDTWIYYGEAVVYSDEDPTLNTFQPAYLDLAEKYKSGLVSNSTDPTNLDKINEILVKDGKVLLPVFKTEYEQGDGAHKGKQDTAGRYYVYVSEEYQVKSATNYNLIYPKYDDNTYKAHASWLTVNKRPITISIDNKQSVYSFQNREKYTNDYDNLTFKITGDYGIYDSELDLLVEDKDKDYKEITYYSHEHIDEKNDTYRANQHVITLRTSAIYYDKVNGKLQTNAVKFNGAQITANITGYTIYAVFAGNAGENYEVSFSGCETEEKDVSNELGAIKDKTIGVNNAGMYTIYQALFTCINDGVYHYDYNEEGKLIPVQSFINDLYKTVGYFNGSSNFFKAHLDDGTEEGTQITFTEYKDVTNNKSIAVSDKLGTEESEDIKYVGAYQAIGTSSDPNYTASNLNIDFYIYASGITLTAKETTVQYGTALTGKEREAEDNSRFDGFDYEVTAAKDNIAKEGYHIHQNVLKSFEDYRIIDGADKNEYEISFETEGYYASKTSSHDPTPAFSTDCTIKPKCEEYEKLKNVFIYSYAKSALNVAQREVEVTIVGWDKANEGDSTKHNKNATSPYLGQGKMNAAFESEKSSYKFAYTYNNYNNGYIKTNETETFGSAPVDYKALGITLKLDNGSDNAGSYQIHYSAKKEAGSEEEVRGTNFIVKFTNRDAEAQPQFVVTKLDITIYANQISGNAAKDYGIIYGGEIGSEYKIRTGGNSILESTDALLEAADIKLIYSVDGLVETELDKFAAILTGAGKEIVFTVKCGDKHYQAWESTVSEKYKVAIEYLAPLSSTPNSANYDLFANYVIVGYKEANLTISPRLVSVSTENVEFGFDGENYNDGASGKKHVPPIIFSDDVEKRVKTTKSDLNTSKYRPLYNDLEYYTRIDAGDSYTLGKSWGKDAPDVVDHYIVVIKLKEVNEGGNYVFSLSGDTPRQTRLKFNVYKLSIDSMRWFYPSVGVEDEDRPDDQNYKNINYVSLFNDGYMDIVSFLYYPREGNVQVIPKGNADTLGSYYIENHALYFKINPAWTGSYTVTIKLKDSANANVQLRLNTSGDGFEVVDVVTASFSLTSQSIKMTIEMDDFYYGSAPAIPTVTVDTQTTTRNLTISYQLINVSNPDVLTKVMGLRADSRTNSGLSNVDKLPFIGDPSSYPNFVAGYYLLTVEYSRSATEKQIHYYVFEVLKQLVTAPEFTIVAYEYTGEEFVIEVTYKSSLIGVEFVGGRLERTGDTTSFIYSQVGNYKATFNLVSSANMTWVDKQGNPLKDAEGKPIGSNSIIYKWSVEQKAIDIPDFLYKDYTYNGTDLTLKVEYNSSYLLHDFAGKINIVEIGTMPDGCIKSEATLTFIDAGRYFVTFTLTDGHNTKWNWNGVDALQTGISIDGITLTYSWTVEMDNSPADQKDSDKPIIWVKSGVEFEYGEAYGQVYDFYELFSVETKDGYKGTIILYYLVNDGNTPNVGDLDWANYKPEADKFGAWTKYDSNTLIDADEYWVMAVVVDPTGENYSAKAIINSFKINPKVIYATVTGEVTYGDHYLSDKSNISKFTVDAQLLEGSLVGNDKATIGDYEFTYAASYVESEMYAGGEYFITLVLNGDGVVKGIEAGPNYIVRAQRGVLTVNRRAITIIIYSKSSDYSVTPDVTDVVYDISDETPLAKGDTKDSLNVKFLTTATATSDAGGEYWINVDTYNETNYLIGYERVAYVINPLEVEVSIKVQAQEEMVFGNEGIWGAELDLDTIKIKNTAANEKFVKEELDSLSLVFSGTSNSGRPITNGKLPENPEAGTYTATTDGASLNYNLVGTEVTFTIQKKALDDSALEIATQTYTGSALTPVVTVNEDKDVYDKSLYNVNSSSGYINAGTYDITVTLADSDNYQWKNTADATVNVKFTIDKAKDSETKKVSIEGWQYGQYSAAVNSPSATVKSGETIRYEYSSDGGNTYSLSVPENGNVGVYYVRVTVAESTNYLAYEGEAFKFEITKCILKAPTLTDNEDTYTGQELNASILGFDGRYMAVMDKSDARTFIDAVGITATAVNAGVYNIFIALSDASNYAWADGAGDENGVITYKWVIAKQKVELPTSGKNSFIVNGKDIVYLPEGFNSDIMTIEGNVYSYGGDFVAVIRLKDYDNYEWANGEQTVEIKWHITGAQFIFIIIVSLLALIAVGGVTGLATQVVLDKRSKRAEAEALQEIENKDNGEEGAVSEGTVESEGNSGESPEESGSETSENTAEEGGEE